MCGRFTLTSNMDELQARFDFEARDLVFRPRYNVAPTQDVVAVLGPGDKTGDGPGDNPGENFGHNRAEFMRWGLIPFWAKEAKIGARMINARAETVAQKPAFRNALKKRRCLVLADGFYEWRKEEKGKTPMYIFSKPGASGSESSGSGASESRAPFAMAGLYETWKSPENELIRSCTIITTSPNSLMESIHDRMPVILPRDAETTWLDQSIEDADSLTELLVPYPAEEMEAYIVSTLVNSAKNDFPECITGVLI